jgi:hypothetical protein
MPRLFRCLLVLALVSFSPIAHEAAVQPFDVYYAWLDPAGDYGTTAILAVRGLQGFPGIIVAVAKPAQKERGPGHLFTEIPGLEKALLEDELRQLQASFKGEPDGPKWRRQYVQQAQPGRAITFEQLRQQLLPFLERLRAAAGSRSSAFELWALKAGQGVPATTLVLAGDLLLVETPGQSLAASLERSLVVLLREAAQLENRRIREVDADGLPEPCASVPGLLQAALEDPAGTASHDQLREAVAPAFSAGPGVPGTNEVVVHNRGLARHLALDWRTVPDTGRTRVSYTVGAGPVVEWDPSITEALIPSCETLRITAIRPAMAWLLATETVSFKLQGDVLAVEVSLHPGEAVQRIVPAQRRWDLLVSLLLVLAAVCLVIAWISLIQKRWASEADRCLRGLQDDLLASQRAKAQADASLSELRSQLAEAQVQLERERAGRAPAESALRSWTDGLAPYGKSPRDITERLDRAEQLAVGSSAQLEKAKQKYSDERRAREQAESALREWSDRLTSYGRSPKEIAGRLDRSEQLAVGLQVQLAEAKQKYSDERGARAQAESELRGWRETLARSGESPADIASRLVKLLAERVNMEQQLAASRKAEAEAKKSAAEANNRVVQLEGWVRQIQELTGELANQPPEQAANAAAAAGAGGGGVKAAKEVKVIYLKRDD